MIENKKKTIGFIILYAITIISVLFGAFAVYNLATVKRPWTLGTSYMGQLSLSEDHQAIASVKIHGNNNNNGQKIYELQFNSYQDVEGKSVAGFGIQCVGDFSTYTLGQYGKSYVNTEEWNENAQNYDFIKNGTAVSGKFSFYCTTDNGTTYYAINYDDIGDYLVIDIEGQIYRLTLKSYDFEIREHKNLAGSFGALLKNTFTFNWDNEDAYWNKITDSTTFTWYDVFSKIMISAEKNSAIEEYSQYPLNAFDLADYLNIEYKNDKGQFYPVEKTSDTKINLSIPVEYAKDGAVSVSDSMFKMVSNSTTWNYWDNSLVKDYWGVESSITLNESQLNYVYYKSYDGYFLSLDRRFENYLKTIDSEINIKIDISKTKYELLGIDLSNFGFEINSFEILNASDGFEILNQENCCIVPTIQKAV